MEEQKKPDVFKNNLNSDANYDYGIDNAVNEEHRKALEEMRERTQKQLEERNAKYGNKDTAPSSNEPMVSEVSQDTQSNIVTLNKTRPSNEVEKDYNAPFEMVKLPSNGKLYGIDNGMLKMAYMTTKDEDILTSPGMLESGEFLSYLFNRKILDNRISYEDLCVGDRNALLIWLRGTGYGHDYLAYFIDPDTGEQFEHTVDLASLKIEYLNIEPDENGVFTFKSKKGRIFKYRLLTVKDVDELAEESEENKKKGIMIDKAVTSQLKRQIVSIDGVTDKRQLSDMIDTMPMFESREFRKFYDDNNCDVDLSIEVPRPGGGSLATFLPLGPTFFWAEL